jgi:hypothetical protein
MANYTPTDMPTDIIVEMNGKSSAHLTYSSVLTKEQRDNFIDREVALHPAGNLVIYFRNNGVLTEAFRQTLEDYEDAN